MSPSTLTHWLTGSLTLVLAACSAPQLPELSPERKEMRRQISEAFTLDKELDELREKRSLVQEDLDTVDATSFAAITTQQQELIERLAKGVSLRSMDIAKRSEALSWELQKLINTTVTDHPQAPELVAMLNLNAQVAIKQAQDHILADGDYGKALDTLSLARSRYKEAGLPPLNDLDKKITWCRHWQFLTKERYDEITIGMIPEQVLATAGYPHSRRLIYGKRQYTEVWIYSRGSLGIARVYLGWDRKVNLKDIIGSPW